MREISMKSETVSQNIMKKLTKMEQYIITHFFEYAELCHSSLFSLIFKQEVNNNKK